MERQKMTNTKTFSAQLASLKSINPKTIKPSQRWKHFGKIAELEAKLAVDEKLCEKRKKING